ncbi:MAG: Sporulation protein [Gemmatimonadetes bacterium]|nr:Sporulation protein [Gemmatimonadota bacterium]
MKRLMALLLLAAVPPCRAAAQQVSPLTAALRLAQDGRIDSARATLQRMEQSTVPTDSLFPGILYSSALVAPTAEEVRQKLQRVIVEYPFSPWAEPAMIALAQLDYANGDPAAAGRTLEKFRTDHGTSTLYAVAALWGARAGFDVNDPRAACQWVSEGLARAGDDASTRAELAALNRKCVGTPSAAPSPAATSTASAAPARPPAPDTAVRPQAAATPAAPPTDTALRPAPAAVVPPPVVPAPVATPPAPPAAGPPVPAAYRVQIVAANSQEAADEMLDRAKKAGFKGLIVKEGGFYKVRLGEYATRTEATAAAARVKAKLGGAPFVVAP